MTGYARNSEWCGTAACNWPCRCLGVLGMLLVLGCAQGNDGVADGAQRDATGAHIGPARWHADAVLQQAAVGLGSDRAGTMLAYVTASGAVGVLDVNPGAVTQRWVEREMPPAPVARGSGLLIAVTPGGDIVAVGARGGCNDVALLRAKDGLLRGQWRAGDDPAGWERVHREALQQVLATRSWGLSPQFLADVARWPGSLAAWRGGFLPDLEHSGPQDAEYREFMGMLADAEERWLREHPAQAHAMANRDVPGEGSLAQLSFVNWRGDATVLTCNWQFNKVYLYDYTGALRTSIRIPNPGRLPPMVRHIDPVGRGTLPRNAAVDRYSNALYVVFPDVGSGYLYAGARGTTYWGHRMTDWVMRSRYDPGSTPEWRAFETGMVSAWAVDRGGVVLVHEDGHVRRWDPDRGVATEVGTVSTPWNHGQQVEQSSARISLQDGQGIVAWGRSSWPYRDGRLGPEESFGSEITAVAVNRRFWAVATQDGRLRIRSLAW